MNFSIWLEAGELEDKLAKLLKLAQARTAEAVEQNDIPTAVTYFAQLRGAVKDLADQMSQLQKHVDQVSYELLPTMFQNQNVKSIKVEGVGRVQINDRWSASMVNKANGLAWLRETGNESLIIETVSAQTLGAFAKEEVKAGKPLPSDIFKVSSTPYVSITQA